MTDHVPAIVRGQRRADDLRIAGAASSIDFDNYFDTQILDRNELFDCPMTQGNSASEKPDTSEYTGLLDTLHRRAGQLSAMKSSLQRYLTDVTKELAETLATHCEVEELLADYLNGSD